MPPAAGIGSGYDCRRGRLADDRGSPMTASLRYALAAALLAAAVAAVDQPAGAQGFPGRPVHLVVSYAPGGTGDIVARLISDRLAAALGQTVVVENRAGA